VGYFQSGTIVNNTAMSILLHIFWCVYIYTISVSKYLRISGLARGHAFIALGGAFQSTCTSFHSYQCGRVLVLGIISL
jgi:hypothetical protein